MWWRNSCSILLQAVSWEPLAVPRAHWVLLSLAPRTPWGCQWLLLRSKCRNPLPQRWPLECSQPPSMPSTHLWECLDAFHATVTRTRSSGPHSTYLSCAATSTVRRPPWNVGAGASYKAIFAHCPSALTGDPPSFWIFAMHSHPHPTSCPSTLRRRSHTGHGQDLALRCFTLCFAFPAPQCSGTWQAIPLLFLFHCTFQTQNSMIKSTLPSFEYAKKGAPQTGKYFSFSKSLAFGPCGFCELR